MRKRQDDFRNEMRARYNGKDQLKEPSLSFYQAVAAVATQSMTCFDGTSSALNIFL
jgi:hypothetical protein